MSSRILRLARNERGRDLIVGDIHGHFTKLRAALDTIAFDESRDRLLSVGDLVDRGPESDHATDWLDKPWFHAIGGNHEDGAILYARGELPTDIYLRVMSGAWNIANPQAERQRLADAFEALPLAIELETAGGLVAIVHADCPLPDWGMVRPILDAGGPRAQSLADAMRWSRRRVETMSNDGVAGVRAVVVGHTPFPHWTSLGNVIFIDTFAWRGGNFTILDAETLRPADKPSRLSWLGVR